MGHTSFIAAVGTPLQADQSLHVEGFEQHLADQWANGMTGVLVAGTMGMMQLLADSTYQQLIDAACQFTAGRGELMIGAGDTSFARTRDRILLLNDKPVDAIVTLSPYLVKFGQAELMAYFTALADVARRPLFLYDLPVLTGTKLELDTVLTLAKHPNIKGIKCSCELGWTRQLIDLAPAGFRVILSQADLVDVLLRDGVQEHLDGVFAVAPAWTATIGAATGEGDRAAATAAQQKLSALLRVMKQYGVYASFSELLNARGIPGRFTSPPMAQLSSAALAQLMAEPIVNDLLAHHPAPPALPANRNGRKKSSVVA
jgi:dihydrodipicolinate synthase/N-acetylneuraminate lyase